MAIDIFDPSLTPPPNYSVVGKKIMVHDLNAAPPVSTKLVDVNPYMFGLIKMELVGNDSFIIPADHKLNGIGIRNNTISLMNITVSDGDGNLISIPLDPSGKSDLDFGKNYFTQDTINITGVTGSVTLLIDIK